MAGKYLSVEGKRQVTRSRQRSSVTVVVLRIIVALLITAVIFVNLFTHVLLVVRYNGEAMEPSLSSGQTLILLKTQDIKAGDVIAFYYNNQVLVRRVIGMGGDQITIETNGSVYIDGEAVEEPYLNGTSIGQCDITLPAHIQADHVFVMGDNRAISMDSRLEEIGTIPMERIMGKLLFAI